MIDFQENMKKLFDVETYQENLKKFYDLDSIKENTAKFYDIGAIQDGFNNLYDVEKYSETLKGAFNNDAFASVKEALASATGNEVVEKCSQLNANLIAANISALTDAVILQSIQLREGAEEALKQADALSKSKDITAAIESQKSFAAAQKEALTEKLWLNVGLISSATEANINLIKEVFGQEKSGSSKKAA